LLTEKAAEELSWNVLEKLTMPMNLSQDHPTLSLYLHFQRLSRLILSKTGQIDRVGVKVAILLLDFFWICDLQISCQMT